MEEIKEIKDAFENLELIDKLSFIDSLTNLFEQKKIEWGETYDKANVEGNLKLLKGSVVELRQLIFALKKQRRTTRRNPYDKANKVWTALAEYFEATES